MHEAVRPVLRRLPGEISDGAARQEERHRNPQSGGGGHGVSWILQGAKTEEGQQIQDGNR